jgi:hypothetical protein
MKVIVDTCVWSQVLRRSSSVNEIIVQGFTGLIKDI